MIYGLNFNRTPIPPEVKRKFSARLRVTDLDPQIAGKDWPNRKHKHAFLQGVCTDAAELPRMIEQANNGNRTIFTVIRKTAATPFYGVYIW